jgi:transcriptional regulator MraZ
LFVGFYQRSIDTKGRLLVPAKVLRKLPVEGGQVSLYVMLLGDHLGLFPAEAFHDRLQEQRPRGFTDDNDLTAMLSLAEECTLDANNRLRLTPKHLEEAGLGRDVVLLGSGDHLEIWSPEAVERMRRQYLGADR